MFKINNGSNQPPRTTDQSTTCEDSYDSNRPPSPFPTPTTLGLLGHEQLCAVQHIKAWKLTTVEMVDANLEKVDMLLIHLTEIKFDWEHASGQAYINNAYASMFHWGISNGLALKSNIKMLKRKHRQLFVRLGELTADQQSFLEDEN